MKMVTIVVSLGIAVSGEAAADWYGQHARAAVPPPSAPPAAPVVPATVRSFGMPVVLTGIGSVAAYNHADEHAQLTRLRLFQRQPAFGLAPVVAE